jgi:ketosteroid isomerase-like protein
VIRRGTAAVSVALALLCNSPGLPAQAASPAVAASSPKATRSSLLQADHALSAAAQSRGVVAAWGEVLAQRSLFLYDGAPIAAGRDNILALLGAQPSLAAMRVQWLPLVAAISTDGTFGATYGVTAISSLPVQVDSAIRFGKYISTWRWSAAGAWQLVGHVEMGLTGAAVVIPPGFPKPGSTLSDPLSDPAAAFARADIDFAKMAAASGAPAAFGAFAAPDAATLPGSGEIVIGPAAIHARMLESSLAAAKWEWHPVYTEGSRSGDLGFTVGEATIKVPNSADEFHSKYLTLWRRQPDGSIRFIVDGGNGR